LSLQVYGEPTNSTVSNSTGDSNSATAVPFPTSPKALNSAVTQPLALSSNANEKSKSPEKASTKVKKNKATRKQKRTSNSKKSRKATKLSNATNASKKL
jgi:hypothetical protein